MKQAEDRATIDWVGGETGKMGGGMPEHRLPTMAELLTRRDQLADTIKRSKPRGAYRGAVKIGCDNHAARARTGKSQAEFAMLCGISERTLRSWEAGRPVSGETVQAIKSKLAMLTPGGQLQRLTVRYRCELTGATWSGRGVMPVWLRVALESKGRTLADFEVRK